MFLAYVCGRPPVLATNVSVTSRPQRLGGGKVMIDDIMIICSAISSVGSFIEHISATRPVVSDCRLFCYSQRLAAHNISHSPQAAASTVVVKDGRRGKIKQHQTMPISFCPVAIALTLATVDLRCFVIVACSFRNLSASIGPLTPLT